LGFVVILLGYESLEKPRKTHNFDFTVNKLGHECMDVLTLSMSAGNHSATSNNMKLAYWPLIGGMLCLVQRRGAWAGGTAARPGPSLLYQMQQPTHQRPVSITVLLCNGPLLWGFNVPIKSLFVIRYMPLKTVLTT